MTNSLIRNKAKKNDEKKQFKLFVLLFVSGFLGLSNNVTRYIFSTIGIGFYAFEIFLIPLILSKNLKEYAKVKFSLGLTALMLWSIYSLCAGIITTGDIASVITCGRSMIYLILVAYYLPRIVPADTKIDYIFVLSLGVLCGDLFFLLTNNTTLTEDGYIHINIFAISYCTIIPFISRNKWHVLFGIGLSLLGAFISGYRINILVLLIALFMGCIYFIKESKLIVKLLCIAVFGFVGFSILSNFVEVLSDVANFLNLPDQTIYRIVERTQDLGSGSMSRSDIIRINQYREELSELLIHPLPQGPIGKALGPREFGLYTDVPISYLIDMFGSIVAILIIICVFFKGVMALLRVMLGKINKNLYILSALMFPVLLCLFIINGTMFSFTNMSVMAGIAIGYLLKGGARLKYE